MSPLPGSKQWLPVTVFEHHKTPRSYVVEYNGRTYRRNRRDLRLYKYEANKVPRVALSSEAQHRQPAEAKSPVNLPDHPTRQQFQASQLRYNIILDKRKIGHQSATSQQQHCRKQYQKKPNRHHHNQSIGTRPGTSDAVGKQIPFRNGPWLEQMQIVVFVWLTLSVCR